MILGRLYFQQAQAIVVSGDYRVTVFLKGKLRPFVSRDIKIIAADGIGVIKEAQGGREL